MYLVIKTADKNRVLTLKAGCETSMYIQATIKLHSHPRLGFNNYKSWPLFLYSSYLLGLKLAKGDRLGHHPEPATGLQNIKKVSWNI